MPFSFIHWTKNLSQAEYSFLSTVMKSFSSSPFMADVTLLADGSLYFHSAVQGHKVDALRRNFKASFCVVERDEIRPAEYTTYFCSVIVFGRVSILESDEEKMIALRRLGERYNPGHPADAQHEAEKSLSRVLIFRMDIDHLTGKQAIELVKKQQ